MGSVTAHRGPDDAGSYSAPEIAIGIRRLSIIDRAGGHQPITNEDGSVWVVCNGEIYNFRELRRALEARGHRFRSASDTEAIVHAYEEYGDAFVDHLAGMFAVALWDGPQRRFLLARDRLGIKPLYYMDDGRRLIFASEAKAILRVPQVTPQLDPAALHQYLGLGYTPAPLSLFAGIRKLPPASLMIVEDGALTVRRYWTLTASEDGGLDEGDWVQAIGAALERAVVSQMVSDVPIGAFLSGGIDSSAIVGFMAKHSSVPVRTYSIGFATQSAGRLYNELPFARQIAAHFGTRHRELLVRPKVVELLPELIWHLDEPLADSAFITTHLVARLAREDVSVVLSGLGGDELFGGYLRYRWDYYDRYYRLVPRLLRERVLLPLARRLPVDRHSPSRNLFRLVRHFVMANGLSCEGRYRSAVGVFSRETISGLCRVPADEEHDALHDAFRRCPSVDTLQTLMHVDLDTQLPDDLLSLTDKMTMAASLECRVPMLDHDLVELAARLPSRFKIRGRESKYILKRALDGLLPRRTLDRPKRGFGAPIGAWLTAELAPLTRYLLSAEGLDRRGFLEPRVVADTIETHYAGREDHTDHLLALISLELWCRIFLDRQSPKDLSAEIAAELRT